MKINTKSSVWSYENKTFYKDCVRYLIDTPSQRIHAELQQVFNISLLLDDRTILRGRHPCVVCREELLSEFQQDKHRRPPRLVWPLGIDFKSLLSPIMNSPSF